MLTLMSGGRGSSNPGRQSRKPRKDQSPRRRDKSTDSVRSSRGEHDQSRDRKKRDPNPPPLQKNKRLRSPRHNVKDGVREQPSEKKPIVGPRTSRDSKSHKSDGPSRDKGSRDNRDKKRLIESSGELFVDFTFYYTRLGPSYLS